jgi:hypothetical protein
VEPYLYFSYMLSWCGQRECHPLLLGWIWKVVISFHFAVPTAEAVLQQCFLLLQPLWLWSLSEFIYIVSFIDFESMETSSHRKLQCSVISHDTCGAWVSNKMYVCTLVSGCRHVECASCSSKVNTFIFTSICVGFWGWICLSFNLII